MFVGGWVDLDMNNRIRLLVLLIGLGFWSCEDEVDEETVQQSTYNFDLIYENTGITKDENNYFHLTINRNSWQTLYRVRGIVYKDGVTAENMKFYWQSNLYWELGDTLGYYIHRGLTDDLEYVSYDTTYITGFSGMEVPTSNSASVSNSDGEVSNMMHPLNQ